MKKQNKNQIPDHVLEAELVKRGYKVTKQITYAKKTFEMDPEVLKEFIKIVKKKDIRIRDAVGEAFRIYIESSKKAA